MKWEDQSKLYVIKNFDKSNISNDIEWLLMQINLGCS